MLDFVFFFSKLVAHEFWVAYHSILVDESIQISLIDGK